MYLPTYLWPRPDPPFYTVMLFSTYSQTIQGKHTGEFQGKH